MDIKDLVNTVKSVLHYKKVESFLSQEIPKASWGGFSLNLSLVYAFTLLAQLLGLIIQISFAGVLGASPIYTGTPLDAVFGIVGGLVLAFVIFVVLSLLFYGISKLFGGKGTVLQQFYALSLTALGLAPLNALIIFLLAIPLVNCLALFGSILSGAYSIYLGYLTVKVVHKLDHSAALKVTAVYYGILVVLFIIVVLSIFFFNLAGLVGVPTTG